MFEAIEQDNDLDRLNVLFDEEAPSTKTHLDSMKKIRVLCDLDMKLRLAYDDEPVQNKLRANLEYYLKLLYSYKRMSRSEFIDGFKAHNQMLEQEQQEIKLK